MKALLIAVFGFALAAAVPATPEIWESFQRAYGLRPDSPAVRAECSVCHTDVPSHNAYGKALRTALGEGVTKNLTLAVLNGIENRDSDGDGWTNGEEIRAGALPGDPKSRPAGKPRGRIGGPVRPPAATLGIMSSGDAGGMLPKHSFHPTLVHFPIALFIFGAFLELLGMRLGRSDMRQAGYWSLLGGLASTAAAIPTGVIAALRMGYALTPGTPVFTHLAVAAASTFAMLGVAAWRRRGERNGPGYVLALVGASILVALAGHLGGGLVYGS